MQIIREQQQQYCSNNNYVICQNTESLGVH